MSSDRVPAGCYMHTLETVVIAQILLEPRQCSIERGRVQAGLLRQSRHATPFAQNRNGNPSRAAAAFASASSLRGSAAK